VIKIRVQNPDYVIWNTDFFKVTLLINMQWLGNKFSLMKIYPMSYRCNMTAMVLNNLDIT
jgi:hypothetical protein